MASGLSSASRSLEAPALVEEVCSRHLTDAVAGRRLAEGHDRPVRQLRVLESVRAIVFLAVRHAGVDNDVATGCPGARVDHDERVHVRAERLGADRDRRLIPGDGCAGLELREEGGHVRVGPRRPPEHEVAVQLCQRRVVNVGGVNHQRRAAENLRMHRQRGQRSSGSSGSQETQTMPHAHRLPSVDGMLHLKLCPLLGRSHALGRLRPHEAEAGHKGVVDGALQAWAFH